MGSFGYNPKASNGLCSSHSPVRRKVYTASFYLRVGTTELGMR